MLRPLRDGERRAEQRRTAQRGRRDRRRRQSGKVPPHQIAADAVQECGARTRRDRQPNAGTCDLAAGKHDHPGEACDQRDGATPADAFAVEQKRHQRGEQHRHGIGDRAHACRRVLRGPCEQREGNGRIDGADQRKTQPQPAMEHACLERAPLDPQERQQDQRTQAQADRDQRCRAELGRRHPHEHEGRAPDRAEHAQLQRREPGLWRLHDRERSLQCVGGVHARRSWWET